MTYFVIILLGGMLEWLNGIGIISQNMFLLLLVSGMGLYGALLYLMQRKNFSNHILEGEICKEERYLEVKAYWDSGNQLRDPYTGQGICILSRAKAQNFFVETRDRFRLVPYRSLGEKDGLLWVSDVDELRLYDGKNKICMHHIAVGVASEGLLEGKEYDLILHGSML